jgi:hypothetical protein
MHFLPTELQRWDALGQASGEGRAAPAVPEALVLSLFTDERPLRGAAGLADWRLCGRLSRLIKSRRLSGKSDEVVMTPPAGGRLRFPRLMIFGLGAQRGFDEARYQSAALHIRRVLERAGLRRYALQPPGRATGLVAPRRALELWLDVVQKDGFDHEVTILEAASAQKEMLEALRGQRRS